jgi:hypothetical protein
MNAFDTSGPARTINRNEQAGARQVLKAAAQVRHMSTPIMGRAQADRTARIKGRT